MKHYLPTWGQCLLLLAVFFGGQVTIGGSVGIISEIAELAGGKAPYVPSSLIYLLSMLFPLGFALLFSNINKRAGRGFVPIEEPRGGILTLLLVFALVIIATPFVGALVEPVVTGTTTALEKGVKVLVPDLMPYVEEFKQLIIDAFDKQHPVDLALSVVILAPLCEELLCRGIMCRGLLAHYRPWFAIGFSALLFAVMHGNLMQGIPAFALGIFMGWVYYKTHSLWSTIAIHFTNNAISLAMMYIFPDLSMDATYADVIPKPLYPVFLIASAAIVAVSITIIAIKYKHDQSFVSFAIRPAASREEMGRECAPEEVQ